MPGRSEPTSPAASTPVISRPDDDGQAAPGPSRAASLAFAPVLLLPLLFWWLSGGPALPLLGALALAFALTCLRYPVIPAVGLLVLVAGPFDPLTPVRTISGVQLTPGDAMLYLATGGVLLRRWYGHSPVKEGRWLFTWPVTAYLAASAVGVFVARQGGDSLGELRNIVQTVAMLAAYFVFRDVWINRPRDMAITLVLVSGLSAAVVSLGAVFHIDALLGRQIDYVITDGRLVDTLRLDPPVLRLLSITLLMITFGRVLRPHPSVRIPLIVAMLTLELLSYTRSTWVPLIMVTLFIPALIQRRRFSLALTERIVVAVVVGIVVLSAASAGVLGSAGRNAVTRLSSATQAAALHDSSLQDRVNEMDHAWQTIQDKPWFGVGFGRPYGAYTSEVDPVTDEETYLPQRFIHNSFVGVWVWLGVPGLLAVLAIAGSVLIGVWRLMRRRHTPQFAPIAAASGLAVLAASTSFQTNLLYRPALLSLAAGLAYLDVCLTARSASAELDREGPSRSIEITAPADATRQPVDTWR